MRIGGILSMSLGGATLGAGLVWTLVGSLVGFNGGIDIIAGTLLGNGVVGMFAVGLPLVLIGSEKLLPGDPRAEQVRLQVTPTGAALTISF